MTSQIIGENVSWTPCSRLCLQAGLNYVLSETKTPTASYTKAVLNGQNNYWTVTFNSAVVLDKKTDLNLSYLYYQASDYHNNSADGLPLGAGADSRTVTAGITRRINPHLRVNVKCAYSQYNDWASGGTTTTPPRWFTPASNTGSNSRLEIDVACRKFADESGWSSWLIRQPAQWR